MLLNFVGVLLLGCLASSKSLNMRISGGDFATIEDHPWMVEFRFLSVPYCGGALISSNKVITTTTCVDDVDAFFTTVQAGSDMFPGGIRAEIESIEPHDKFDKETHDYDIAIITLANDLEFSDKIQPVKLPSLKDTTLPVGSSANITGWGPYQQGDSHYFYQCQVLEVQVQKRNKCGDYLTDSMLCATNPFGQPLDWDRGDPLVNQATLWGVWSYGHGYTDITKVRQWIKDKTNL